MADVRFEYKDTIKNKLKNIKERFEACTKYIEYDDEPTKYTVAVLKGEIIACIKIKQACLRHLEDLERIGTEGFEYEYNVDRYEAIFEFSKYLKPNGSNKSLELADFQHFILGMMYGWRDCETLARRFRKFYISMGRKNGKSMLIGLIMLFELIANKYRPTDRQLFVCANSEVQAQVTYGILTYFIKDLSKSIKTLRDYVNVTKTQITIDSDDSFIQKMSSNPDTKDGLNALVAILDEFHSSPTNAMYEVMNSSMVQQLEPMLIIISTAGFYLNYYMHDVEYKYITSLLDGETENDQYLAICYEIDDKEEVDIPEHWIKANPIMSLPLQKKLLTNALKDEIKSAKVKGTLNEIIVKNFNKWVYASKQSFMYKDTWELNYERVKPDIRGKDIYIGLDLSRNGDISAVSYLIPIESERRFYIDTHGFIGYAESTIEAKIERDKIDYLSYEQQGYCTVTKKSSGYVDYDDIYNYINKLVKDNDLNVKGIFYDKAFAGEIVSRLENLYMCSAISQGYDLSLSISDFQYKANDKAFIHNDNPLLTNAMYNAVVSRRNDALMIRKDLNRNKIDPVVALITAYMVARGHFLEMDYMITEEDILNGRF